MKRWLMWSLLGGAAIWLLFKYRQVLPAGEIALAIMPQSIQANYPVTVGTYRIIAVQRPGMQYVQAQGQAGSALTFNAQAAGTFTGNFLSRGGGLWAEIAAA
jgi:hypothetical protein